MDNAPDVLKVVNEVLGKDHRTLDAVTEHELRAVLVALMIQVSGAKVFMCNPHDDFGKLKGENDG